MEKLSVAGMEFAPGRKIVVTGKPGTGKSIMAKRFANAAMDAGARPIIVTTAANIGNYRGFAYVACNEKDIVAAIQSAITGFGHLVLVIDHPELSEEAKELLLRASDRSSVTTVAVHSVMPPAAHLDAWDEVIATGVHQVLTTAEEVFQDAVGFTRRQHGHWQCARWVITSGSYEIIDL